MLGRRSVIVCLLALGLIAAGCSAIINPDEGRFGADDAGPSGVDAGPGIVAGPGRDAGPGFDAGPSTCERPEPFCRGDALVTCTGGFESVQDCQARDAYCEGGDCREWECEPDSRVCSEDLGSVIACNARGNGTQRIECTNGLCNPETGMCGGMDVCEDVDVIELGGTKRVDLCSQSDDNTFTMQNDCNSGFGARAGDRVYRLWIESDGVVEIELLDEDLLRFIDTVVYVRRQCDDARSQIACSDDTPCMGGPVIPTRTCRMGTDVGRSRIRMNLTRGYYYIVVDAFLYDFGEREAQCGTVELHVRPG